MTLQEVINLLAPAVLTVILNIIFYLFIKSYADRKIEQNKIIYSGLFQEKLQLYRELMRYIADVKKEIFSIDFQSKKTEIEGIRQRIWDLSYFMTINEVFWSERMANVLIELTNQFDEVCDQYLTYLVENDQKDPSSRELFHKRLIEYRQHLSKNRVLNKNIGLIVEEMREDLQIKSFNKYV